MEWSGKTPLDFKGDTQVPFQGLKDFEENMKIYLKDVQFSYNLGKAQNSSEASQRYKNPSIG